MLLTRPIFHDFFSIHRESERLQIVLKFIEILHNFISNFIIIERYL